MGAPRLPSPRTRPARRVAGTYVKEFVHGDMGRTTPNLGDLLACEADILQLDVTGLVQGE